jgi:hypothetical protein
MPLSDPLRTTLVQVAAAMTSARYDWWIIASAAIALHGADPGNVRDVDVLFDSRDAEAILAPLGLEAMAGTGDGLFRSSLFATWLQAPLPVELFAGFQLCEAGQWRDIVLATREPVTVDGHRLWIPQADELHALLMRFGRGKDLARAALLSPSGRSPSRSGSA